MTADGLVRRLEDDSVVRITRRCPICDGASARVLFRQRFTAISGAALLDGYDVVACPACGFIFADGIPGPRAFEVYYRDLSKYENQTRGGEESEFDSERLEATVEAFETTIPSLDSRILEIGCSTGRLLASLARRGYTNVRGLDPSPQCARVAHALYNVEVNTGTLGEMPAGLQADFVVMVGVLEHLPGLRDAIQRVKELLPPTGRLYIEVPDAGRFSLFPGAPFQQFSVEHINFFSGRSLTNLMLANAFRPVLCGNAVRQQSAATPDPTVYGVYELADSPLEPIVPDRATQTAVCEYILQSEATDRRIREVIDGLVADGRPIVVWRVGTHTQRLMATSSLSKAKIAAFVDSNPKYQGKTLNGVPVVSPTALRARTEPILVSSHVFEEEIERQIRVDLGLTNEVVLLYSSQKAIP